MSGKVEAVDRWGQERMREVLTELVRSVKAERIHVAVRVPDGRQVTVRAWDGKENDYGDPFSEGDLVLRRSTAFKQAVARAEEVLASDDEAVVDAR